MGLDNMHRLTTNDQYSLRFEFLFLDGSWKSAEYDTVVIDAKSADYTIHVTGFSGDTNVDVMNSPISNQIHNGMPFSTRNFHGTYCSQQFFLNCGWWFNNCALIAINTDYDNQGRIMISNAGLPDGSWQYIAGSRMMIRSA